MPEATVPDTGDGEAPTVAGRFWPGGAARHKAVSWLLCDYGNVLCLDQPAADRRALAAAAGRDQASFTAAYWAVRDAYDRGRLSTAAYWSAVCGRPVTDEELERLVALDVASWTHPNRSTLAAVSRVRAAGRKVAILSNAPVEIAAAAARLPWLAAFSPQLFSCDLGRAKPDLSVFATALERLGATPGEVCFVDDRPANVEAARRCGMLAIRYREPAQLEPLAAQS